MKIAHITLGQAGLHAENSAQLQAAVRALHDAGYAISGIEDDPEEPWHVATINYTGAPANAIRRVSTAR